jgi:hypothetical protein
MYFTRIGSTSIVNQYGVTGWFDLLTSYGPKRNEEICHNGFQDTEHPPAEDRDP